MKIYNGSGQVICCGDTLKGEPQNKSMILRPGEALNIEDVLPRLVVEFATTPDGLRMAIREDTLLYLPPGKPSPSFTPNDLKNRM